MTISALISLGTTATTSSDVTVESGKGVTFTLLGNGIIYIETKGSDGTYKNVGYVSTEQPVKQAFGPITFRAVREAVKPAWRPTGQAPVTLEVGLSMDV